MLFRSLLFLESLKNEIVYTKLPVPAIIKKLSADKELGKLMYLSECSALLEKGEDFPEVWKKVFESVGVLKKEEKDKLLSLGSLLGISDTYGQQAIISLYITYFQQYHSKAQLSLQKYGTTVPVLCFFVGSIFMVLSL